MSESEPSQPDLQDVLPDTEYAYGSEEPVVEQPDFQSVEQATALLRSCWKFAAVVQFSRMFAVPLKLKVFAADLLESALITPDNHRMFLSELLFKLLRADALQPYSEKDSEAWETLLYKKLSAKWPEHFQAHPLAGTTFYDTTPSTRVDVLFALCDWRVHDCPVVKDVIKRTVEQTEGSVDALRQEPIGEDSRGNLYYYFSFNNEDCRLYRQEPLSRESAKRRRSNEGEPDWETVCTSIEEMADFVESLSAARSGKDKVLHDVVSLDILPQLLESAAARRRAEEKQAAIEAMPKKRSSRLQELTSKKEEEDRLKAQQLADRLHRQRENERIRKEREREERLLARQRDDERQVELQRRLAGIHPEAPSREERLQRRMKSSQAGSSSDSGGLQAEQSQFNSRSSARLAQQAQHAQHTQQQSSPRPPSHQQDEQESYHPHRPHRPHRPHHHQQNHQQQQQQQQQPAQPGPSRQHAQHDNQDSTDQAESGLLTRLRPRSTRRRTFQESFAWSPLEVPVPQRRRTDLDLRPRKNVAGLVAAAQGLPHCYGRNRRGKWVLYDQVEESTGQQAKATGRSRGRSSRAVNPHLAGPTSPAASRDSGAGKHAKLASPYAATSQRYLDTGSSYSQQQQQQQWVPPQSPVYAAQSASHSGSWSQQQPPHQRQQLQQQQLNSQQIAKAELQSLVLQLTPQQREHLSKMPHDKRMHFFHNLRNQMARAQQQQQQQLQLQQQMGQQGSWQQPSGLQQTGAGPMQQPGPSSLPQASLQQQQYEQQLQQLTLRRLSPQQMQQLHDLPVEQRAMHFGHYMRQTQLHLQQHQMQQQQQYPSQAMAAFQPGMVPTAQAQQQQQQVAAGIASQAGMAMQQHGSQQQLRQPGMQQPGYSPGPGPGMYAEQGGIQQQAGMYPGMAQAYPTSAAEQLSRPMSPPGLPRGPSQPATVSQRSQIKSPSGQFLGPQMIRPAMATNPMAAHQMAGNQMVGGQMAGNQMAGHHMRTSQMPGSRMAGNQIVGNTVSSPKSPSAMQPASLQSAVASGSNGMAHAQAQAQAGPQASNSASSRPNSASSRPGSASSQEGTGGSGQSHVMPQGRAGAGQADVSAPQAAVTYPSGQVGPQMQQAGYGASGYGSRWTGGLQAGMNRYPSSSQPSMMHGNGMQQQQQQAFTQAQPGMPLQAASSQSPQATCSAQAGQPPFPLHHPASKPAAQSPSTSPPTSATAAPAGQAPTASQTPNLPPPSGMTQQPQGTKAQGPSMTFPGGQPANLYGRGSAQQLSPYGDYSQPPMYSSNPDLEMGSFASRGANSMHTMNGLHPEHAPGIHRPEAHEASNGMQAMNSNSAAAAPLEQPQPTQSSSAATDAPANAAAAAAGYDSQQEAAGGVDAEVHDASAAADGADKAVEPARDAIGNVVHQSELAKGDVSEAGDLEDELIEPQILAGGQSIPHNLLAD